MERTIRREETVSPMCGETDEPLDDVPKLSGYLGTAPSWLYSRTRDSDKNGFPVVRVGKYLRFRRSEVLRWLKDNSAGK